MKKLLLAAVVLLCAAAITVQAQGSHGKKTKKELTAKQKKVQTDMLAKYETSKDGKLDKTEKAAMSEEDKAAWAKAFPARIDEMEEVGERCLSISLFSSFLENFSDKTLICKSFKLLIVLNDNPCSNKVKIWFLGFIYCFFIKFKNDISFI